MRVSSTPRRHKVTVRPIELFDAQNAESLTDGDDRISLHCELLLTPEDVADVLRIGRTRVYDLINTGVLRSLKIGRLRRVRRIDLEEFIAVLVDEHNGRGLQVDGCDE
jgi:excisionase family DNA binding protein